MAHTNRGRVILGGLLAGVVINLVEFVTNGVILKDAWGQVMQALQKSPGPSGSQIVMFNVWGFLVGISAVWLYAAIRPRYGRGAGTAVRAGVAVWVLAYFLANLMLGSLGVFPARLLVITGIVGLAEVVIATVAGASIYKEEAQASATLRAAA